MAFLVVLPVTASNITIDDQRSGGSSSGVTSRVFSKAEGDAGGVNIDTTSLSLINGGGIDTSTFGRGNAGSVQITASDITIDGEGLNGVPSGVISAAVEAEGNAGEVSIDTTSLSLINGGIVIIGTLGQGNAGDVTINASESITISGFLSGISADTFSNRSNGGNINIFTDQLTMNNGGRIEATTQSEIGEAANIKLTIAEDIFFKNNSLISARAFDNANGGNVTINANNGSIVAFPNQNNDIIANAQQGNGGNINIATQGIFGLAERSSTPINQTNDIDASSQFGLQGTFSLDSPENEPTRGLVELPKNVVNPEDLISQNACKQGAKSKFTVTGRGGLPATPEQIHYSDEVEVGLVKPARGKAAVIKEPPVAESETKRVPARGWIRNEKGEIFLVGYDPTISNIMPQPENLDWCQPRDDD